MSDLEIIANATIEVEPDCKPMSVWIMLKKEQQKIVSGLVVPDVTANARATFYVLKVGPDVKIDVKEGDQVILTPDTWAVPVTEDTRKYMLVREDNICGVLG